MPHEIFILKNFTLCFQGCEVLPLAQMEEQDCGCLTSGGSGEFLDIRGEEIAGGWEQFYSVGLYFHLSMALQPFVGPWLLLQFHYTDNRTPWTSDQAVSRPLPTNRTTQTQNKRTQTTMPFEWDSNPRSQRSSERRQFMH
jgi:hypothetical protein